MSDLARLYQELILDHHRAPRNAQRVEPASHAAEGNNPLCGDRVQLSLRVLGLPGAAGKVTPSIDAIGCEVRGCALCRASGSISTELVLGRSVAAAVALAEGLLAALAPSAGNALEGLAEQDRQRLAPLLEVRQFPSRRRCATLAWETLRDALVKGRPGAGTP